jgi:hypothetical protein
MHHHQSCEIRAYTLKDLGLLTQYAKGHTQMQNARALAETQTVDETQDALGKQVIDGSLCGTTPVASLCLDCLT